MNFYLLELIGKWLIFLLASFASIFNLIGNNESDIVTEVVAYKTIKNYDSSIPSNIQTVTVEGKDGLVYTNELGEVVVLEEVIDEQITIGTGKDGNYTGIMTGYGPDCYTCSGEGYVACRTREKKDFNIITDGLYYNDIEFGESRVLAAALSEFPCGTIVEVESKVLGTFTGIVLDTGYDMRKHLGMGIYHFDVAYSTEKDEMVPKTTDMSGTVKYNVQRWGW